MPEQTLSDALDAVLDRAKHADADASRIEAEVLGADVVELPVREVPAGDYWAATEIDRYLSSLLCRLRRIAEKMT